ncbi:MAG: hypothetical protein NZL87_08510, partial [Thermomicrobium sp.]|nr:hypothetical protein [Thermomicrobium sp.]
LTAFAFSSPFLPDAGAVRDLLSTSSGVLWGSSVVVALLLYALLAGPVPRGVLVGGWGFGASALALFRAGAGHAATAPYPVLSIALAALHLAAASALIGGTLMLVMAAAWLREVTERVSRSAVRLVRRMFLSALLLSEVLTVSGAYNLWTNIATPRDLLATPYGRILLVKLAVATVALGIVGFAARSAFRSRNWTIRRLRWGALSVFLILPFATGLVMLPPPRAAVTTASIAARPLVLAQHAGPYLVTLRLDPALPGTNRVTVHVTAPNGTPVDDAQVTLAVETPQGPRLIGLRQGSQDYTTTIDMTTDLWSFDVYVQRPHETAVPPARFRVPVPVPDGRTLLQLADLAMNRLQSVEERTELTSGGPVVVTVIRYAAPDRATYTVSTSGRPPSQTVIIGDRRYDRVGDGEWTVSPWPGSSPYRWPAFRYAESAEDVRILGIETIDSIPCYLVSFHDP